MGIHAFCGWIPARIPARHGSFADRFEFMALLRRPLRQTGTMMAIDRRTLLFDQLVDCLVIEAIRKHITRFDDLLLALPSITTTGYKPLCRFVWINREEVHG